MRNTLIVSLSIMFIMAGCQPANVQQDEEILENSMVADIFRHHYSVTLFQFGYIMSALSELEQEEDLTEIRGMVKLYVTQNPPTFYGILDGRNSKVVQPEILDEIYLLVRNQKKYIQKIQPLLEEADFKKLKEMKDQFAMLHQFERDLNDHRYLDDNQQSKYIETLNKMNNLLSKFAISN